MKKLLTKIALAATALVMMFAFASCGCSADKESTKDGGVIYCEAGELCIVTAASEVLVFNVENAEIDAADTIEYGDLAEVVYTGEIKDGDASECTVSSVTVVSGDLLYDESEKASNSNNKKAAKVTVSAVSDKVYVTANDVAVRASYDVKSTRVGTVNKGKKLTRTGKTSNGWSRIKYDGKDAYVINDYLSTKAPKATKKTSAKKTTAKKTEKKTTAAKKAVCTMNATVKSVVDGTLNLDTATGNEFSFSLSGADVKTDLEAGKSVTVEFEGNESQPGKLLKVY